MSIEIPGIAFLILINAIFPWFLIKMKVIKRSSFLSCFTWFCFFSVTCAYFKNCDAYIQSMSDIWLIFAASYFFIYEYGEWIDYDQITR